MGQYWTLWSFMLAISRASLSFTCSWENGPPTSRVTAGSPQMANASGKSSLVQWRNPSRAVLRKYSSSAPLLQHNYQHCTSRRPWFAGVQNSYNPNYDGSAGSQDWA